MSESAVREVNLAILKVWSEAAEIARKSNIPQEDVHLPKLYPEDLLDQKPDLLTISINPGFTVKTKKGCWRTAAEHWSGNLHAIRRACTESMIPILTEHFAVTKDASDEAIRAIYEWPNRQPDINAEVAKVIESVVMGRLERVTGAGIFRDIPKTVRKLKQDGQNLSWTHIDLFFWRDKDQKRVGRLLHTPKYELTEFGQRQFELSCKLIKESGARIVLIANADAGKIFRGNCSRYGMNIDESQFEECGYPSLTIQNNNTTRRVPVFISGMLSGGHLDVESRNRLEWLMRRALQREGV